MKRILLLALIFLSAPLAAALPQLKGHVNDYAGMLSSEDAAKLELRLSEFEKTDSTQLVILTIETLDGLSVEDYGIRLADEWKIGRSGRDNGVILIVSKSERKIRIEAGRGLEGKLTDLVSGRIIRNIMAPAFKSGDFSAGIVAGTDAIVETVRGEYSQEKNVSGRSSSTHGRVHPLIIVFAVVIMIVSRISRVAGGVMGAAGVPFNANMFFGPLSVGIILALIPVGFFAGVVSPYINVFSFFGSGGSRGGGSSFSGGGGKFGGGGASGGW